MQLYTKPEAVILSYPLRSLGDPDDFLFFDIETTGLTPANAQVYMIGTLSREEGSGWTLRQWFAESLSDEAEMLTEFFAFAGRFRTLVHYNGDTFDIPFLMRCALQYGIPHPFAGLSSLDLYRAARPYRKIFGTERMNQRSMEAFLGLKRMDRFTGGELISVYETFTATHEKALRSRLLLHNEEDLTGLPVLLSLLSYRDFFLGAFRYTKADDAPDALTVFFRGEAYLPQEVSFSLAPLTLSASEDTLSVRIPKYRQTMAHYFENYRDYYYLPHEDRAVHKSVGEFVDRSARVKCTARNACVRKDGCFLPLFGPALPDQNVFQAEYRGAVRYVEEADFRKEPGFLEGYVQALLKAAGLKEA